MAATVTIRVYTGSGGSAQSSAASGISFMSIDNPEDDATVRAANPVSVGASSYEKWVNAYVDVAPDNAISNFQVWGDGGVQGSTSLFIGKNAAGANTPVNSDSAIATNDFTTYVVGTKFAWHATNLTGVGSTTDYLVFQLDVDGTAAAGNWTQETVSYSYDET